MNTIAVNPSAGVPSVASNAFQAASRLASDFLQLQGIHRAHHPDLELGDVAFRQGADLHAVKAQIFEDGGDIRLRARKPVKGFAEDNVELAPCSGFHQGPQAWSIGHRGRRERCVVERADHDQVASLGEAPAYGELICNRGNILQVS
ncbi:hypothetical protein NI454_12640 [Brevundimonas diminuta]|nr:hypothetical protein [Brevundimonas diminuta]MCO8030794.1 hypothetical protein [Brevundimonas diminuta]